MRTALLSALLFASCTVSAERLVVVVHTRDAMVRTFRTSCGDGLGRSAGPYQRVVRTSGYVNWHAVGGVQPYTLLEQSSDGLGNVQVIVSDAAGSIAIGYGVIQTVRTETSMPCPNSTRAAPAACADSLRTQADPPEAHDGAGPRPPRPAVRMKHENVRGEQGDGRPGTIRSIAVERGTPRGGSGSPYRAVQHPAAGR
ncbi:MAG: hypothetical protein IPK99_11105 [Flavobacteriales bacterium]|nr:hypothetical protein [Flavobacteriales bacterium]